MILNPVISAAPGAGGVAKTAPFARGVALFLGVFTLLNLAGDLRVRGFDLNLWWIDLRVLPGYVADPFLFLCGLLLAWFALRPAVFQTSPERDCDLPGVAAARGAWQLPHLLLAGAERSGSPSLPVPLSLLIAAGLGLVLRALLRGASPGRARDLVACVALAGVLGLMFPLAQMILFGKTDYRRSADVAVVMGARVYADGRLSDALKDRVRTACDLYHQRLVNKLIMSGGPGDGAIHETEAMARAAIQLGVDPEDIIQDQFGLNTGRHREEYRHPVPRVARLAHPGCESRVSSTAHQTGLPARRHPGLYRARAGDLFPAPDALQHGP